MSHISSSAAAIPLSILCAGILGCQQGSAPHTELVRKPIKIPAPFLVTDVQRAEDAKLMSWLAKAENSAAVRIFDQQVLKPVFDDANTRGLSVTALEVTSNQLPRVHQIVADCARVLHLERVPRVFVGDRPGPLQIVVQNYSEPVLVIPTQVLRRFRSSTELTFVIGRELGHIKAGHTRWLTTLRQLQSSFGGKEGGIGPGTLLLLILRWSREAELTADRFGLLCCQDLHAAEGTIVRMATGVDSIVAERIEVDAFLQQGETQELSRISDIRLLWRELNRPAPFAPDRVRELRQYCQSPEFKRLWQ
jgi:Zn-dependent protease with chaperone function